MADKLTDPIARAAAPRPTRYEIYDAEIKGFCLDVTPSGAKTWRYRYRTKLREKRVYTIGPFGTVGATAARRIVGAKAALVAAGRDPVAEEKAAREEARAEAAKEPAMTVRQFGALYIEEYSRPHNRPSTVRGNEAKLNQLVYPAWGNRPVEEIGEDDAAALLRGMAATPVHADRTRALLSRMWNWGRKRRPSLVGGNIVRDIAASRLPHRPRRYLKVQEIGGFWTGLDRVGIERRLALALKIQLATFARPGEVLGMHKGELDDQFLEWTIPAARMKGKRAHVVPITDFVRPLLREAIVLAGAAEFVFQQKSAKTPVRVHALDRAFAAVRSDLGVPDLTPHGLRTTCTTHAPRAGIDPFIKKKLLAHADGSVTGTHYDFYEYLEERRAALDAWHRWLTAQVAADHRMVAVS